MLALPAIKVRKLIRTGPDAVQWYYPLEGDLRKAQTVWDSESPLTVDRSRTAERPQAARRCWKAHVERERERCDLTPQCSPASAPRGSAKSSPKTRSGVSKSSASCPRVRTMSERLCVPRPSTWLRVVRRSCLRMSFYFASGTFCDRMAAFLESGKGVKS